MKARKRRKVRERVAQRFKTWMDTRDIEGLKKPKPPGSQNPHKGQLAKEKELT